MTMLGGVFINHKRIFKLSNALLKRKRRVSIILLVSTNINEIKNVCFKLKAVSLSSPSDGCPYLHYIYSLHTKDNVLQICWKYAPSYIHFLWTDEYILSADEVIDFQCIYSFIKYQLQSTFTLT